MRKQDAPVARHELGLHRSVFECQSDGVIAVDFDGTVRLFNPAAARILGMDRDEVVGRLIAELFVPVEGLDEFSQVIFDAVSERAVSERRIVGVHSGGKPRSLAATTSYLQSSGGGPAEKLGVIVVFSDITEIEELRAAEARMAESLRARHVELQQAYRQVEDSNATLEATNRKIQTVRIAATGLIIALFAAAGAYSWVLDPGDADSGSGHAGGDGAMPAEARPVEALRTVVVRPKPASSTISFAGRLAPWRTVTVTSPVSAKVAAVHFQYGKAVQEGERLVELDTAEINRKFRDARRDYINVLKEHRELQDWENSSEVARARRDLTRAEVALRNAKDELDTTAFLLNQGVIPANQHEAALRNYRNQQLDLAAAMENLEIVLAKNSEESRQVTRLALDNAQERMRALEHALKNKDVLAPISGIVLDTREAGANAQEGPGKSLTTGQAVQEGQALVEIGDFRRMSAVTAVDEVFIPKVKAGQRIRATGDGFPGLVLEGAVSHVSSEARSRSGGGPPRFAVTGLLDEVDAAQRERLRLGMSVDIAVQVYRNPEALMVPLAAVRVRQDGSWLKIRDKDPLRVRDVKVETGVTTVGSVEILSGIRANDEVVLPGK